MSVRPSAVADLFYPGKAQVLSSFVADVLAKATLLLPEGLAKPKATKAIIVPHAGYIYSAAVAAYAYALIRGQNINRVVLLGPAHRLAFSGLALAAVDYFATPLGDVQIDAEAAEQVLSMPDVQINDAAHAQEHALEVQLPFLQTVLGEFVVLPVCVGSVKSEVVAQLIESLWGDERTLFVISSDLSHFHEYDEARVLDQHSIELVLAGQGGLNHGQACGATAINAWLSVAARHGLSSQLLDYRNSGDTAGDKQRVVGYASIAFFKQGMNDG
ncbi:MAG: AmmeMemoRadiSam system protein B [Mariprofundus sp.]|nr:AmmeMemoRadiSam system protein B [Mariprofundus sp.]